MSYSMREWFEMHWKLRYTPEGRANALNEWDDPEFQKSIYCERGSKIPVAERKFWLRNLMEEMGELSPSGDSHRMKEYLK